MTPLKRIHFGNFIRSRRIALGLTVRKFSVAADLSEPRVVAIEKMDVPRMYDSTLGRVAQVVGFTSPEELHNAWNTTPVAPPEKRAGRDAQAELKSLSTRAGSAGLTAEEVVEYFSRESVRAHLGGADRADGIEHHERAALSGEGTQPEKPAGTKRGSV